MSINTLPTSSQPLSIARVPSEVGPIIRCSGELTLATGEALKRQLDLLGSLRHPALILNLSGCRSIDVDGVLLLLSTFKRLRSQGRRFALVAGTENAWRILQVLGIEGVIPVFPSESVATLALRGGGPPAPGPPNWEIARTESLATWRGVLASLEHAPVEDLLLDITSAHALCWRAEAATRNADATPAAACRRCPLFRALGARPEDVGCDSVTQPMLEALLGGDRSAARTQVVRLLNLIETLPLPEE